MDLQEALKIIGSDLFMFLLGYFVLPISVLTLYWILRKILKLNLTSAADIYVFLLSLEFSSLIFHAKLENIVRPEFVKPLVGIYAFLVICTLACLLFSLKVEKALEVINFRKNIPKYLEESVSFTLEAKWPWFRLLLSWTMIVIIMTANLSIILL